MFTRSKTKLYGDTETSDSIMIVYKIDSITKMKVKNDHRSKCSNLIKQLERRSLKTFFGFNGIRTRYLRDTGAMLYQLSYEATHWKGGQFIEFISHISRKRNDVK